MKFLFIQWTVVSTCANDFITARKGSCGKVMFLDVSVSHSVQGEGWGCLALGQGVAMGQGCASGSKGYTPPGHTPWSTPPGHTPRHTHPQTHTPLDTPHHTHLGHTHPQQAGGMHPTGMLSYLVCYFTVKFVNSFVFYCPNCDFCYVNLTNED